MGEYLQSSRVYIKNETMIIKDENGNTILITINDYNYYYY